MQSDKDLADRPHGKLYASLPPDGIPLPDGTWVEEGSLVQSTPLCMGFVNAPSEGHATTPCIFLLDG